VAVLSAGPAARASRSSAPTLAGAGLAPARWSAVSTGTGGLGQPGSGAPEEATKGVDETGEKSGVKARGAMADHACAFARGFVEYR